MAMVGKETNNMFIVYVTSVERKVFVRKELFVKRLDYVSPWVGCTLLGFERLVDITE